MVEMHEIAQQAKNMFLEMEEVSKLLMDKMYETACKISKQATDYCIVPLYKQPYDLVVCVVVLLRSLNMNTPEFTLSQL